MKSLVSLVLLFMWVFGVILAQGVASTVLAIFIPFWAWYLSVSHLLVHFNLI